MKPPEHCALLWTSWILWSRVPGSFYFDCSSRFSVSPFHIRFHKGFGRFPPATFCGSRNHWFSICFITLFDLGGVSLFGVPVTTVSKRQRHLPRSAVPRLSETSRFPGTPARVSESQVFLSVGFQWLSVGCQWLSVGFQWLAVSFQWLSAGFQWLSAGFQWVSVGLQWLWVGFQWLSVGFQWLSIGFQWLSVGFQWVAVFLIFRNLYLSVFRFYLSFHKFSGRPSHLAFCASRNGWYPIGFHKPVRR